MSYPYTLSLKHSVTINEVDNQLLLADRQGQGLRLNRPSPGLKNILANLRGGGLTADQLIEDALGQDRDADLAQLHYLLTTLEQKNWLCYTLNQCGLKLATLEPVSAAFRLQGSPLQGTYRLSRFACLRRLNHESVLESPLGHARVIMHHGSVAALVLLLAEPRTVADLTTAPGADLRAIEAFVSLLVAAGAAFPCDEEGRIAEDESEPLRQWEYHDIYFHSRSRMGRHGNDVGGLFPFIGEIDPLPAVKPPMSERRIALCRPTQADLQAMGLEFFSVLDARRSVRERGAKPLTAAELGIFLHSVGRIQQIWPANPELGHHCEASLRPCASGGAIHEIELYLTVSRCEGIAPGFYHYDPATHSLEHLAPLGAPHEHLLADARMSMAGKDLDVLITMAARFQRTAWKYRSVVYALIMKNVGALYQQMYLVATALKLAPCALGSGNSDHFAAATGLDYYTEGSVGEFVLSSR